MTSDLREAARMMRALALLYDERSRLLHELAFAEWRQTTLFAAAVNRWIEQAGEHG